MYVCIVMLLRERWVG